jgi:hypothetical protein
MGLKSVLGVDCRISRLFFEEGTLKRTTKDRSPYQLPRAYFPSSAPGGDTNRAEANASTNLDDSILDQVGRLNYLKGNPKKYIGILFPSGLEDSEKRRKFELNL